MMILNWQKNTSVSLYNFFQRCKSQMYEPQDHSGYMDKKSHNETRSTSLDIKTDLIYSSADELWW